MCTLKKFAHKQEVENYYYSTLVNICLSVDCDRLKQTSVCFFETLTLEKNLPVSIKVKRNYSKNQQFTPAM